jgi:hypothetical protein
MRAMLRRLHQDTSGQILVFLVFAAILLMAFVVEMVATGQRVLSREQLQDAADAGAFGAAVVRAKALNLLAFTNLLQAAFLAVAVALGLVADVLAIVAGVLSGICASSWLTGQVWACGLVPTAWDLQQQFSSLRDRVRPEVIRAARSLGPFQDAVRDLAPAWAAAEAALAARDNAADATVVVLPFPTEPLPVERGSFADLCEHSLSMVVEPIRRLPPEVVFSRVAGWVDGMLGEFGPHYCGEEGGGGATRWVHYDKGIPPHPTDPPTPGAGCDECRRQEHVKRFYLTREDETWDVIRRPGQPPRASAPVRAPPEHVESPVLLCAPSCDARPHCQEESFTLVSEDGAWVEKHRRSEWTLDACVVREDRRVDAGEPLPGDILPLRMKPGWAGRGEGQTRAFALEGESGGRWRLDAWRAGGGTRAAPALAVAQAEFCSLSGDGLWTMDWRARLRRFRAPRNLPLPPGVPPREWLGRLLVH